MAATEVYKISLDEEELAYAKAQPRGWARSVIRRFMDTDGALTPEELIYLRDHGGTRGVIAIAKGEKSEGEFEPVTGEFAGWSPKAHGGEMQPTDDAFCRVCQRPLYDGVCRNTSCAVHQQEQEGITEDERR